MDEEIFRYQEVGAKWLSIRKRALLADEMGLGKSAQVVIACDAVGANRVLVLCPAVGRLNWIGEFQRFSKREKWREELGCLFSETDRPSSTSGIICSYNLMTNNSVRTWILSQKWDIIVLDEVHYLKSRKAQRTKSVFDSLVPQTTRVWALSGTPAPNHGGELYPLLRAFKAYNEDYWAFIRRFCKFYETPFGIKITGTKRIPELRDLLALIILRRRKKDVLKDLPPIIYTEYAIEAGEVDMNRWYPELETRMTTPIELQREIEAQRAAIEAVVNVTGLGAEGIQSLGGLQIKCAHSRRHTGLQKVDAVVELITGELKSGAYDKKVIFCIHKAVVEDLREKLRQFNPVTIYGGTPANKRDQKIKKFQKNPDCHIFIGNIQAAGTMINLTAAHHVDVVESSWVPGENAQAVMRTHRIGQTKLVSVRFFYIAGNATDMKIQRVIRLKTRDLTQIFDSNQEENVDPFEGS